MTDRRRTLPDDEYHRLLTELSAPPTDRPIDWDALNARIEQAAALPLARLRAAGLASVAAVARAEPLWWELTARRARALLPLAVAASLVMFAYIQRHPVDLSRAAAIDAREAYAAAVTGGASSTRVTSLLVAAAPDAELSTDPFAR